MAVYRIEEFLQALDKLTLTSSDKEAIKIYRKKVNTLVKKEIEYLRSNLTLASLRRARTEYRNANRKHHAGKNLTISYKGKWEREHTHIAVKYFTLKKSEVATYIKSEESRKNDYLVGNRLIICDAQKMIDVAESLLDSESAYNICAGLLLLTGRRTVEIWLTGNFEVIKKDHVLFSGQAKNANAKEPRDNYEIPVLADANKIANALTRLREIKNLRGKTEREVNSLTSNRLGKVVKKHFSGFIKKPINQSLENLQDFGFIESKNLRPCYVHIAHQKFMPLSDLHKFAQEFLGHTKKDTVSNLSLIHI